MSPSNSHFDNKQKKRTGLNRIWHAFRFSLAGFQAAWSESAFRQEAAAFVVLTPVAFYLGTTWVEVALLVSGVLLVCITELLNTAIEKTVDRVGPEEHILAKQAKDIGSAAVLLSLLLCVGIWAAALWHKFF